MTSRKPKAEIESAGSSDGERSVLSLIRDIQSGAVAPENLTVHDRRQCVEHLTAEGYSLPEIAQVLKTADRTISRDRAAIRQANSIQASPQLTGQVVGQLLREADISVSRLRRATRGPEVQPSDKIEAEKACWVITRDLVGCLQKLGYLPTAAQAIHGTLSHELEAAPGYAQLQDELDRVQVLVTAPDDPTAEGLLEQVVQVKDLVTRMSIASQVQYLTEQARANQRPVHGALEVLDE